MVLSYVGTLVTSSSLGIVLITVGIFNDGEHFRVVGDEEIETSEGNSKTDLPGDEDVKEEPNDHENFTERDCNSKERKNRSQNDGTEGYFLIYSIK